MLSLDPSELYADLKRSTQIEEDPSVWVFLNLCCCRTVSVA
jgi:hypothetical protein